MWLFQVEENRTQDNTEMDCQYRNYNEIVEELIKATTEADANPLEEDKGLDDHLWFEIRSFSTK